MNQPIRVKLARRAAERRASELGVCEADVHGQVRKWSMGEDYAAIIGTRLDAAGMPLIGAVVAPASTASRQNVRGAASDGQNFFVLWNDTRDDPISRGKALYGARIGADGTPLDPEPIQLSSRADLADVVFDGANYVITWVRRTGGEGDGNPFYTVRVSPAGERLDIEPIHPLLHSGGYTLASASDGTHTLLVGDDGPMGTVLAAVLLDQKGDVASDIAYVLHEWHAEEPAVSFDGLGYLVAWVDPYAGIFGQRITQAGALDGPVFSILDHDTFHAIEYLEVAAGGGNNLVVWGEASGIWATRVSPDGQVLDPDATLVATPELGLGHCDADVDVATANCASVIFDGQTFVVAWRAPSIPGDDNSLDLYAVQLSPDGEVLSDFVISNEPEREGPPFLAVADGHVLAAYSRFVPEPPYDTRRAMARLYILWWRPCGLSRWTHHSLVLGPPHCGMGSPTMSIMMNRRMHELTFAAVATAAMLISAEAEACHEATVCVKFQVKGPDLVVGDLPVAEEDPEDPAGDPIAYLPATSVRILLVPPPPEAPVMTLLDENGCFTFLTEWNDGHKLFVYPEAFLHSDDTDKNDPHIHITAHSTEADLMDGILPTPSPVDLNGMEEGYTARPNIEVTREWEVFAWAVWITRRVEDELDPGLPAERIMQVTAAPTDTGHATFTSVHQDDHDLRFAIAHEVGHWFHQNWIFGYDGEGGVGGGYGFVSQDPYCTWMAAATPNQHGIRSSEFERAAIAEGFAQFFAAWVFDDPGLPDALFRWYKIPEEQDEAAHMDFIDPPNVSRVSLLGGTCDEPGDVDCPLGGTSAWVENVCDPDWDASFVSSEMDWMRLFWQFISDEVPDDDMEPTPTLQHIFLLHEYAWNLNENPTYANYDTAINNSINTDVYSYRNRFNDLAVVNGASKNAP